LDLRSKNQLDAWTLVSDLELTAMQQKILPLSENDDSASGPDVCLLLTKHELAELTGTRQAARQRRWLQDRGWPFLDALGRNSYPRVSTEVARQHLAGRASTPAASNKRGPNFAALAAVGAGGFGRTA
jgi:hypothetical protein